MPEWSELGLWGVFIACFLASTVVPFSSELVVTAYVAAFPQNWQLCLLWSSVGNTLGSITTYALGRLVPTEKSIRWLSLDAQKVENYRLRAQKYGAVLGLLGWTPFFGDLIAFAMGVVKTQPLLSFVYFFIGKTARYAVLIASVLKVL